MLFCDLVTEYEKWLYLYDTDILPVTFATLMAHRYKGNPVWLLLIGPAGGGKTEILMSMARSDMIYRVDQLTPAAIASGHGDGQDSFCYQASGKIAIIKDFGTTCTMHSETRADLFGKLREIYDGSFIRKTGRIEINWEGKIGMIAAATYAIESGRMLEASLGERFMTIRMPPPNDAQQNQMISKDTASAIRKETLRNELAEAAKAFLDVYTPALSTKLYQSTINQIRDAAKCIVKMRTGVVRNQYSKEIEYPLEVGEAPTRINSQLELLAMGLTTLMLDEHAINHTLRRLLRDNVPYTRLRIITALLNGASTQAAIASFVKISQGQVSRLMEELEFLNIIKKNMRTYDVMDPAIIQAIRLP